MSFQLFQVMKLTDCLEGDGSAVEGKDPVDSGGVEERLEVLDGFGAGGVLGETYDTHQEVFL